jgi:hypothetical protein
MPLPTPAGPPGPAGNPAVALSTTSTRTDGEFVGEIRFETDTESLIIWNGTRWLTVGGGPAVASALPPTDISVVIEQPTFIGAPYDTQVTIEYPAIINVSLADAITAMGAPNTLTLTLNPSVDITAGSTLTVSGLTGSQTTNSGALALAGRNRDIFGSSGVWTQSSGTLVLTIANGQSVSAGSDTEITFTLTNPDTVSPGVSSVQVSSSGFATATIPGTFLNVVETFNVPVDTEENIFSTTPNNPSGEVNIAFSTDTKNFFIYDGSKWNIYNNDL